ncbi:hypothetical protein AMTR_s00020p00206150 [Amborella trichopoda]|uniref:Uncharacterized protein n=1 Tax=Amborella trichopoda TaxID=13333 RepID=W1PVZ6_AMBTC|nr:hypothetical protein AMTR_s00020p00206150 [Amborella trichopoda]
MPQVASPALETTVLVFENYVTSRNSPCHSSSTLDGYLVEDAPAPLIEAIRMIEAIRVDIIADAQDEEVPDEEGSMSLPTCIETTEIAETLTSLVNNTPDDLQLEMTTPIDADLTLITFKSITKDLVMEEASTSLAQVATTLAHAISDPQLNRTSKMAVGLL